MVEHILLAYSGGLDTSYLVHWLKVHHAAKVTAMLVDLGQNLDDIESAVARAKHNGAEDCIVVDAKTDFANGPVAAGIQCNLRYQGIYPLATALGRPLIAHHLVKVAQEIGADAIAHGCTGKGNDQVRIETAIAALAPNLTCLAPQRTHPFTRDTVNAYAKENGLTLPPVKQSPFSVDENLWGRSMEGNEIEDLQNAAPEAAFQWSVPPAEAPIKGIEVAISFNNGLPVAMDGVQMPLELLIATLNKNAGAHGIGRIDMVEDRLVGIKSRELYEAPAATVIQAAKTALEQVTLTKEEMRLKPGLEQRMGELCYDGLWQAPVVAAIHAALTTMQTAVNGTIVLQMRQGAITVVARDAPMGLYNQALATYDSGDAFDHQQASGFIHVWALPLKTVAARQKVVI